MICKAISSYFIFNFIINKSCNDYRYNTYVIACFHAVSSSLLCIYSFSKKEYLHYYYTNTFLDNIIISNSIGYFFTDLIKCLYDHDTVFIVHHIIGILFLMSSYLYQLAGTSAIGGLLIGEISNPILHCGWFLKYYKNKHFLSVWKVNTFFFFSLRICISPFIAYNFFQYQTEYIFLKTTMLICYFMFYSGSLFWFIKQMMKYIQ